jgi:hypothetical protein
MLNFERRAWRWLAPVALVGGVGAVGLAACGDEDSADSTRTADVGAVERAEAAAGSDQHLYNQAAAIAERAEAAAGSDQHLYNQAAEIAGQSGSASGPNVWEAGDRAAAERLTAQAERYADQQADQQDEFVPGTRRMPMR